MSPAIVVAVAVVLVFALPLRPAYAHGESVQVSPSEAKPGEPVAITGKEFTPGEEVKLSLEGVRGSVSLDHAEVDESGNFSVTRNVPENISPGSYQLVATTEDDSITVDFTVLEAAAESHSEGGTKLVFQRSNSEVIAIGLITVALILGGVFLVVAGTRQRA